MKTYTTQEIIDYFNTTGPILEKATWTGEYKNANKIKRQSEKYFKALKNNEQLAKNVLDVLLESTCVDTKITAAKYSLVLNIYVNKAKMVLAEIIDNPSKYKIYSFNAKMTMQEWQNGNLN